MLRTVAFALLALLAPQSGAADEGDFFEAHIRPLLHEHCLECHGPERQKGGLRVDSREALLAGGESGPAVRPGEPGASLLLKAVRQEDKDLQMPPRKAGPKLSEAAIADLSAWVQHGAFWPPGEAPAAAAATPTFDLQARQRRLPWIWETPQRQAVPDLPGASEVDRFILAKLKSAGLTPAPPTDDLTWLRRVHFAITGLPPQRGEIQAFVHDASPQRREHAADALLASPHFGERWARHWMDLVRYAESRGHEGDYLIANAWRYRDYLIRAFNADLPYDRFVAEHLAGDLLPPRLDAATGANESVLATGWAFLGEENHSPVDIRQDECERVDNKVDVLSKTFLGLTVACARCHDHKFDAITQQDYYALCGFVLSSPYRQVRFETMQADARAAAALGKLRAEQTGPITRAFAAAVLPGVATIAAHLMEAQGSWSGKGTAAATALPSDPGKSAAWLKQLQQAAADPLHPLQGFALLAKEPGVDDAARFPGLLAGSRPPLTALPPACKVIADFTKAGATPWKTDGPVFGLQALAAGSVIPGTPEQPIARVLPYGAASRDAFWNRLSLSPGTETDPGSLGAGGRAGRTLLTPKVTLGAGRLHYLIRGNSQVYAGVDSHIMITGPLHGGLVVRFDTGGQLRWVTHDLTAYAGHRLHLEFAPQGEAPLDVLMVVESPEAPSWLPVTPWQPRPDASSLADVAASLQADFAATAKALASGSAMEPAMAPLADWLVQHASLLGAASAPVAAAATDYFRELEALAKTLRWDSPTAVSWGDGTGVDEHILIRGKPTRTGAPAPRGLPLALGLPRITAANSSGRAELAAQLTDPSNPLVARVMVNRIWHHLFGRGIVPTVDNFGYLGERPSHPELLDHLAWQFVHEDGWSLQRLIRRLVLTDTFSQSSRTGEAPADAIDPANLLLHRMPVRRLEGEAIRDSLLVVSGRFNPKTCGPPVTLLLTEFSIGRGQTGANGTLDGEGRRSIYLASRRNFLPTMMRAFDLPTPFSTVGRRNVTNVPAQSLVLMNDPFVHAQARGWAERLQRELPAGDDPARLTWLFETAYGRPPTPGETSTSLESLADLRSLHAGGPDPEAWGDLCHALLNMNEFIYLK